MNADGVRLFRQGKYHAASSRFTQAISHDPLQADGYYNLAATHHRTGKLYQQQNELTQAETLYNQCLDRDPNHPDCYRSLAVLLVESDRSDAAVRLLEGWNKTNPALADPKIELARIHEEFGEHQQAKVCLEEALQIEPHNARALAALGKLREGSGEPQQALANYQRSLAINRFQPQVAARVAHLQATVGSSHAVPGSPHNGRFVAAPAQPNRYY